MTVRAMAVRNYAAPIDEQIVTDHQELRTYYDQFETAKTPADREKWYHQFAWAVAVHSVAEEIVLYPMLEDKLGEYGKRVAQQNRSEHGYVKNALSDLEKMKVTDAEFGGKMKDLRTHLEEHMSHEEKEEMVKLRETVPEQERKDVGVTFERRKKIVPTRAHPSAPDHPAFLESVVGLMAAPIDKMMDWFRSFPSMDEVESTKKGHPIIEEIRTRPGPSPSEQQSRYAGEAKETNPTSETRKVPDVSIPKSTSAPDVSPRDVQAGYGSDDTQNDPTRRAPPHPHRNAGTTPK